MKYNASELIVRLRWQVANTRRKAVTSVLLADGETEIPWNDQLHQDLEAFEAKVLAEKAKSADTVAPAFQARNIA